MLGITTLFSLGHITASVPAESSLNILHPTIHPPSCLLQLSSYTALTTAQNFRSLLFRHYQVHFHIPCTMATRPCEISEASCTHRLTGGGFIIKSSILHCGLLVVKVHIISFALLALLFSSGYRGGSALLQTAFMSLSPAVSPLSSNRYCVMVCAAWVSRALESFYLERRAWAFSFCKTPPVYYEKGVRGLMERIWAGQYMHVRAT